MNLTLIEIIVIAALLAIVIGLVLMVATGNTTTEEYCEWYKFSTIKDIPAYCLQYFTK